MVMEIWGSTDAQYVDTLDSICNWSFTSAYSNNIEAQHRPTLIPDVRIVASWARHVDMLRHISNATTATINLKAVKMAVHLRLNRICLVGIRDRALCCIWNLVLSIALVDNGFCVAWSWAVLVYKYSRRLNSLSRLWSKGMLYSTDGWFSPEDETRSDKNRRQFRGWYYKCRGNGSRKPTLHMYHSAGKYENSDLLPSSKFADQSDFMMTDFSDSL